MRHCSLREGHDVAHNFLLKHASILVIDARCGLTIGCPFLQIIDRGCSSPCHHRLDCSRLVLTKDRLLLLTCWLSHRKLSFRCRAGLLAKLWNYWASSWLSREYGRFVSGILLSCEYWWLCIRSCCSCSACSKLRWLIKHIILLGLERWNSIVAGWSLLLLLLSELICGIIGRKFEHRIRHFKFIFI